MTLIILGYKPASNVVPTDPGVGSNDPNFNLGWNNHMHPALVAEGGADMRVRFDGSESEDEFAGEQCVLDHALQTGKTYVIWVKAYETGSGLSWANSPPALLLAGPGGSAAAQPQPPHYGNFWGGDTGEVLTGTAKWFWATVKLVGVDGEYTPNSLALWVFPIVEQPSGLNGSTRTLVIDAVVVEPVVEE
jgi:hypothetical protein